MLVFIMISYLLLVWLKVNNGAVVDVENKVTFTVSSFSVIYLY